MDFKIKLTGDGADIDLDETTEGLETASFLSLLTGDFWADKLETDPEKKYPSRLIKLMNSGLPLVPFNLSRIEDAATKDLDGLPTDGISVLAEIVGLNRLKLTCTINESLTEYVLNWGSMKGKE